MKTEDDLRNTIFELSSYISLVMKKMEGVKPYGEDWQAMLRECNRINAVIEGINYAIIKENEITLKY